jgi:hypothetical protein
VAVIVSLIDGFNAIIDDGSRVLAALVFMFLIAWYAVGLAKCLVRKLED